MSRPGKGLGLALAAALLALAAAAQEDLVEREPVASEKPLKLTERTFRRVPAAEPPAASIDDVAWIAGHWVGQALGGTAEEIWSPPRAGAMMGMFRLVREEKTAFYELLTIVEEEGGLVLRLKHFNADLTGWEEKGETVDFPLVALAEGAAHFEGMSFYRLDENRMTIYLAMRQKDGGVREAAFPYARAGSREP